MNLETLRDYLAFLADAEQALNRRRQTFLHLNSFSFYTLLAPKAQPALDSHMIVQFIASFTYNFQPPQLQKLLNDSSFQLLPEERPLSREELLAHGVDLFLKRYTRTGTMSFQQFSLFLKEEQELPQRTGELSFALKKAFFELLEEEIQNLLDAEGFRKAVALHYRNLDDLFELLSCEGLITQQQVANLFLGLGQRKDENYLRMLGMRFPMPMDQSTFRRWFTTAAQTHKYKQQTKIYYSSVKRKKYEYRADDGDGNFTTPGKKTAVLGRTSTKLTKAERLSSIKRSAVQVSRFVTEEAQAPAEILASILGQEERVNEMKRQLLYQPDYDLELIYERSGAQFQDILNRKYGSCNFTSFVRYIVPQDYEHRYYAFIKYNKKNCLSEQTRSLVEGLLEAEQAKEGKIQEWWQGMDREMVWRGYCQPGQEGIHVQQLERYFTGRECKLLLDRLDPHGSGLITLDHFF